MKSIEDLLPVPDYYQWATMSTPVYGVVALGFVSGNQISDIRAYVERLASGEWFWKINDTDLDGVEPSKYLAMKKVEQFMTREERK